MAIVALRVPHETGRLLHQISLPERTKDGYPVLKESTDTYHITVFHLGDDVPAETLARCVEPILSVTTKTRPFSLSTERVISFQPNNGKTPVVCKVESPELHTLRSTLANALDANGIDYSKKWPDFKPHVTLAYIEGESSLKRKFPPVVWGAHDLVLWGGDHGDERMSMNFPFALGTKTAAVRTPDTMHRFFVRLAMWGNG